MEYTEKNQQGFTLSLITMKPIKAGIAVAYLETQNSFGPEGLKKVLDHAYKNDLVIGGWMDEKTGLYYFDSVKIFKKSELVEAIQFAIENEQIAIFDITNLTEIRL